jgi:acyl-CoA dehydrogenase
MHTLEIGGSEDIKEEYLRPLVQGEKWSAFSMTEPMDGGGSDPKMLQTTAEKDGDEWVINGHNTSRSSSPRLTKSTKTE